MCEHIQGQYESGADCGGPVVLLAACEVWLLVGVIAARQWGNNRRRNEKKVFVPEKGIEHISDWGEGDDCG